MTTLEQQLEAAGVRLGQAAAHALAEELRAEAAQLAPGRLGEALQVENAPDGARLTMPHYAKFVEFGTRRMAARPFLRPAFERVRARLQGRMP